ncbi:MAG TPA: hypothetical protein VIY52_29140 [Streptosporangiaceae bacterium]
MDGPGHSLLLVNATLVLVTVSEGVLLSIVPSSAAGIGQLRRSAPGGCTLATTLRSLPLEGGDAIGDPAGLLEAPRPCARIPGRPGAVEGRGSS